MRRAWIAGVAALCLAGPTSAFARSTINASAEGLAQLSLEELANIDISSVSKAEQPLSEAPAAVFVITHEDAARSGATSLAELLRLAPNLQVAGVTASSYAISARGFNGTAASKLLVLIDGRSVYSPYASGVFWDVQDVPMDLIERVEVISGPGATLWGANAVNGVINVTTKPAAENAGVRLEAGHGDLERHIQLTVGGKLGADLDFRAFVRGYERDGSETAAGGRAFDDWRRTQGGFQVDWRPPGPGGLLTFQGGAYGGSRGSRANIAGSISGHHLISRWSRQSERGGALQLQTYYDYQERVSPGVLEHVQRIWDLDLQHALPLGEDHRLVWGGGYRVIKDRFAVVPGNPLSSFIQGFSPERRTMTLANVFVQDTLSLTPSLKVTAGLKLEDDPYVDWTVSPSLRASWTPGERTLVWAAVSRAVRAPSRLDRDFFQAMPGQLVITGGAFVSEKLVSYEVGYRGQPTPRASLSVSAFYNVYDDLRSFELEPGGALPLTIRNEMEGETWGVEAWGAWQAADWWRLSLGANRLWKDLRFKPGSFEVGGTGIAGNDPKYQVQLGSRMDLPGGVGLDLRLRKVAALPQPASRSYVGLDGRIAWAVTPRLELSLVGRNLLEPHHPEFGSVSAPLQLGDPGVETHRSLFLDARLRF